MSKKKAAKKRPAKRKPAMKAAPTDVPQKYRNRVKEMRFIRAGDLLANPKNWREHPKSQRDAMDGVLADVGVSATVTAYDTPEGLRLIDGHLRADMDPEQLLPCAVLDVTDDEADKLLATMDPLGAMATTNAESLNRLMSAMGEQSESINAMLRELQEQNGVFDIETKDVPALPTGDRAPFQQMTFTLHDTQVAEVKNAIAKAKHAGGFTGPNENSNGNALARVAEAYCGTG